MDLGYGAVLAQEQDAHAHAQEQDGDMNTNDMIRQCRFLSHFKSQDR
jgi:hypothetical protein